jgi:aminopeptidase N
MGALWQQRFTATATTEWKWRVHYPINNYDVALNIGEYQHWNGVHVNKATGEQTTLDYYALPEDLVKAKLQFGQVPEMLDAYEHYFGEYPFDKDGYKLIEVPYAGMEHQTAVAYGNHFENGYYGRDWTGVGISPKFDFIIIHESGHEWFGNSITAADPSDMWIHEGWTTYMESLYVEYRWGKADAMQVSERAEAEGGERAADHSAARHQRRAAAGPVLQGRADVEHAAQRHRRRCEVVRRSCTTSTSNSSIRTS